MVRILNIQDIAYKNFKIKRIKPSLIIPSQFGIQYENKNSKNILLQFRKFLDEKLKISDLIKENLYPILVNINNNKIIDGNHRHYALSKINSPYIVVLYVDVTEK